MLEYTSKHQLVRFTVVIIFIFTLFFSITFLILMIGTNERKVPNLINKDLIMSVQELQRLNLKPIIYSKYSSENPRYSIIFQNPRPGMTVKEGRKIILIVSKGKKINQVPKLIGTNIIDARMILLELYSSFQKLPPLIINKRYSSNYNKDIIINQIPSPGSPINEEENIILLVSRGIFSNQLRIPNYRWKYYRDIKKQLEDLGVDVKLKLALSQSPENYGKILKQNVKPGSVLKKGDDIIFTVASAPDFKDSLKKEKSYRFYTISIPHRQENKFKRKNKEKSSYRKNEFPLKPEQKASEKTKKYLEKIEGYRKKIRKLTLIVVDKGGESTEFSEYVYAGSTIDIPYQAIGSGEIKIYLDGKLYKVQSF